MQVDIAIRHSFTDAPSFVAAVQKIADLFAALGAHVIHPTEDAAPVAFAPPAPLPAPTVTPPTDAPKTGRGRTRAESAAAKHYVPVDTPPEAPPAAPVAQPPAASAPATAAISATPVRSMPDQIAAAIGQADLLGATDDDYLRLLGKFGVQRARDIPVERHAEALAAAQALVAEVKARNGK